MKRLPFLLALAACTSQHLIAFTPSTPSVFVTPGFESAVITFSPDDSLTNYIVAGGVGDPSSWPQEHTATVTNCTGAWCSGLITNLKAEDSYTFVVRSASDVRVSRIVRDVDLTASGESGAVVTAERAFAAEIGEQVSITPTILDGTPPGPYTCTVDWADGIVEAVACGTLLHTYDNPGVFYVELRVKATGVPSAPVTKGLFPICIGQEEQTFCM